MKPDGGKEVENGGEEGDRGDFGGDKALERAGAGGTPGGSGKSLLGGFWLCSF